MWIGRLEKALAEKSNGKIERNGWVASLTSTTHLVNFAPKLDSLDIFPATSQGFNRNAAGALYHVSCRLGSMLQLEGEQRTLLSSADVLSVFACMQGFM